MSSTQTRSEHGGDLTFAGDVKLDVVVVPEAMRGSFGWYRAIDSSSAQNQQRNTRRLAQPVLAIGGPPYRDGLPSER